MAFLCRQEKFLQFFANFYQTKPDFWRRGGARPLLSRPLTFPRLFMKMEGAVLAFGLSRPYLPDFSQKLKISIFFY
jgi:hypothetical protein